MKLLKLAPILTLITFTSLIALPGYPKFVAHRGGAYDRPENTLDAFERAYEMGARAFEFDCWFTQDREVVVHHDPSLLRTAKTSGHINNFTLDQLKQLEVGSWFSSEFIKVKIPTFKEVLQFAKDKDINLLIEVKDSNPQIVDAILAHIEEESMQNPFLILSKKIHILQYAAQKYPHIHCAYVLTDFEEKNIQEAKDCNIQHLVLDKQDIYKDFVSILKQQGFFLFVYTLNDLETSLQFLAYGVDSIISDHIDWEVL